MYFTSRFFPRYVGKTVFVLFLSILLLHKFKSDLTHKQLVILQDFLFASFNKCGGTKLKLEVGARIVIVFTVSID